MQDGVLEQIEQMLEQRKGADPDSSYVAKMYAKGEEQMLKKVAEEAAEVIMAVKDDANDKVVYELADLWFHAMLVMAHRGISVAEVEEELGRRFGVSGLVEKASRNK